MKEPELRRRAICSRCQHPIGAAGIPVFAVVRRQDYILNLNAIQRQTGLGLAFGGTLAMHMGPDADMASPAPDEADLTLCALCRAAFEEWLEDGQ